MQNDPPPAAGTSTTEPATTLDVTLLLNDIPDFGDAEQFRSWIDARLAVLATISFDERTRASFAAIAGPDADLFDPMLGPYGSLAWRRFAAGLFLADWASYEQPADRADFARLLYVVACFPRGFTLWMCRLPDGQFTPVGYTGWYPIPGSVFEVMCSDPGTITHRGFMGPLRALEDHGSYLYLFNASIVPALRGTKQSRALMYSYARTIARIEALGKAAVTVSPDGVRASRAFGLSHVGNMTFEGEIEQVFAVRHQADHVTPPPTQS